ncbi:MAG: MarC family protein [Parachlamydiales bacterium]|nr:MarC family protein [Parachlamydiales bacterium]
MFTIVSLAITLFLVINSLGMAPALISFIADFPRAKQRSILLREAFFAFVLTLVFAFIGRYFFAWLNVTQPAVQVSGGLILFFIALRMIFPQLKGKDQQISKSEEPFIVPIATPMLAGPAVLATVMIESTQVPSHVILFSAIIIAFAATTAVLIAVCYLQKVIGARGLNALEKLMGLILTLLAVQMLLKGAESFVLNTMQPIG